MNHKLPAWMRLTCQGRLNRFRYFWYSLGVGLILGIPQLIFLWIYGPKHLLFRNIPLIISFIYLTIDILATLYSLSFMIRRLRDLNHSLLFLTPRLLVYIITFFIPASDIVNSSLFFILPILEFLLYIYLLFFKGTTGPNPYGPDPLEYESYEEYLQAVANEKNSENSRFEK